MTEGSKDYQNGFEDARRGQPKRYTAENVDVPPSYENGYRAGQAVVQPTALGTHPGIDSPIDYVPTEFPSGVSDESIEPGQPMPELDDVDELDPRVKDVIVPSEDTPEPDDQIVAMTKRIEALRAAREIIMGKRSVGFATRGEEKPLNEEQLSHVMAVAEYIQNGPVHNHGTDGELSPAHREAVEELRNVLADHGYTEDRGVKVVADPSGLTGIAKCEPMPGAVELNAADFDKIERLFKEAIGDPEGSSENAHPGQYL